MKIFTLLHKSTDKGTVNIGGKSRIIPMKPLFSRYCMFTVVIMLLLGAFSTSARGATCYVYEETTGATQDLKQGTIFETAVFENTDGIDYISFTYHTPGTFGYNLKVEYSTDGGESYNPLDVKGKSGKDKDVDNTLTGDAKRANRFKFSVNGGPSTWSYEYAVKNIKIRKAPTVNLNGSSTESYEFSQTAVDASADNDFTVTTYNVGDGNPSVSISGTNSSYFGYTLSSASSDCPKTYTLTITYTPGAETVGEAKHSATVKVLVANKDTATLTVYGTAREIATPEYTWHGEDTYYVEGEDLDLSTLWTSTSGGDIEYGFTFTPAEGEQTGSNAPQLAVDGHTLSIGKAGRLDLTLTQDETTGYTDGIDSKTINIVRRDPVFAWNTQTNYYYNTTIDDFLTKTSGASYTVTSNNEEVASIDEGDLTIYNKPGTVKIKYVHPQTYKWNEKKDSVTFTPGSKNDTVSFSLTDGNHTTYESANTFSSSYAYWNDDKDGYFLGATSMLEVATKRENYAIIHFTGIPDTLYFNQRLNKYAAILPKDRVCYVMVSANGSTWNDTVWRQEAEIEYMNNQKVCLPSSTRYIKFYYNGTISSEYKNIRVSKRKYFKTDKASLDFATNVKNASCDAQTFKFHHAGAGYITSVSSSDSHFTVSPTSVTTGGEICDSAVITVSYSTAAVGEHSGTITISDNIGNSTSVSVTGTTVDAYTPTITWPGTTSFVVGSTIANGFVAKDNNNVTLSGTWSFESSDSTVIDIVEGELKAICGGTATITGTIAEGATWSSGSQTVSLTVTKPNDAIEWSNVAEDGKIHVWAESDVPYSIATANTAIRFTTRNAAQLTVNAGPTIDTLRTVAHSQTPVWLVATTAGSCAYNSIKDSIQITVEPCYHEIIWNQTFAGLTTAEDGTISEEYDLNAYAVDSNGVATNIDIIYSMPSVSFATLEGSHLTISGIGETTITATTDDDSKFATVVYPKTLKIRRYGEECESNALPEDVAKEIAFKDIVADPSNPTASTYYLSTPVDSLVYYVRKYAGATTGSFELLGYDFATGEWRAMESGYGPGEVTTNSEGSRRVVHFEASDSTVRILKWESNADIGKIHWTHYQEGSKYILKAKAAPRKIFEVNRSSITRGVQNPVMVNTPFDTTITLRYCDKPHINYTYTGSVLNVTTDKEINNDCGDYGTYTFRFRGEFTKTGRYQDTIFFKTSAGDSIAVPFDLYVFTVGVFTFDNAEGDWRTSTKWSYGSSTSHGLLPTKSSEVTIKKSVTISAEVEAYSVSIEGDAKVTILPGGGLTVGAGGIVGSTTSNLILKAGTEGATKGQTGYLRISPEYASTMPNATVELYSTAYHNKNAESGSKSRYQCVGAPISDAGVQANTVYPAGTWLYTWNESTETWTNSRSSYTFVPFQGFETTQKKDVDGLGFNYEGHLVSGHDVVTIDLAYTSSEKGYNLLANSWAAPISIEEFKTGDFIDAERTVYILNAGTKNESDAPAGGIDAPGKWVGVPLNTASALAAAGYPCVIPSMQGFWVKANGASAQLKLDYSRLVWGVDYSGTRINKPLRAPKRNAELDEEMDEEMPITGQMMINVSSEQESDVVFMLESERFETAYENGNDAYKIASESLDIYTVEDGDKLSVDATSSMDGTQLGIHTNEETAFTLSFSHVSEEKWALFDMYTNEKIDIYDGTTYTFFEEPNAEINGRFMIVEREAPSITTGVDNADTKVKVHKFIKDNQVFILKNGVLYNTMGAIVR